MDPLFGDVRNLALEHFTLPRRTSGILRELSKSGELRSSRSKLFTSRSRSGAPPIQMNKKVRCVRLSRSGVITFIEILLFSIIAMILGVLLYGVPNTFSTANFPIGNGDSAQTIWLLSWVAHAISQGHNPLITRATDLPLGANLMFNTPQLLLGVLFAPLTLAKGPVLAFNVLIRLCPAVSALSAFLVLRSWTKRAGFSAIGGLMFGFSPYVASESGSYAHVPLIFLAFVPPIFFLVDRTLLRPQGRTFTNSIWLGLLLGLQFWISTEVFVDLVLVVLISWLFYFLPQLRQLRLHLGRIAQIASTSLATFLIVVGFGLYEALFGPQRVSGAVQSVSHLQSFRNDLAEILFPSPLQVFTFPSQTSISHAAFNGAANSGSTSEFTGFIGIALLVTFGFFAWRLRKTKLIHFMSLLFVVSLVLSLGSRLQIDGHVYDIPLPEALLPHLPLLNNLVPSRFAIFAFFAVVVVATVGLVELFAPLNISLHLGYGTNRERGKHLEISGKLIELAVPFLLLLTIFPHLPVAAEQSVISQHDAAEIGRLIPEGANVLSFPFLLPNTPVINILQADANFRFNLLGGDLYVPQNSSSLPQILNPSYAETRLLVASGWGNSVPKETRRGSSLLLCEFVLENHVTSALDISNAFRNPEIFPWFSRTFGAPTYHVGGYLIWNSVQQRCLSVLQRSSGG